MFSVLKKIGIASVLTFVSSNLLFSQAVTTRNRYALVIGNQNYSAFKVQTAIADSNLIKNSLESRGFKVSYYKDLNSEEIKKAVSDYASKVNADKQSVSLFYYTGHGFSEDSENYIVPVDNGSCESQEDVKKISYRLYDVTDKIACNTQIVVMDASHGSFFKQKGTRALAVKGVLSEVRAKKLSSECYLFSAQPGESIEETKGKTTVFANELSDGILRSEKTMNSLFDDIKGNVISKTNNMQSPYSSATSVDFAFNGAEYISLKQRMNANGMEVADAAYAEGQEKLLDFQNVQNDQYAKAQNQLSSSNQAFLASYDKEQEIKRLAEEQKVLAEKAREKLMQDTQDSHVQDMMDSYSQVNASGGTAISKNASAEKILERVTMIKEQIYQVREKINEEEEIFNKDTDDQAAEKVYEVRNRTLSITEKDKKGNMTSDARKVREKEIEAIYTDAANKKAMNSQNLQTQFAGEELIALKNLNTTYKQLERKTYTASSLTGEFQFTVGQYDEYVKGWPVHVTGNMFDIENFYNANFNLSYEQLTGKKAKPLYKMTSKQRAKYDQNVDLYNSLFEAEIPVFYVKMKYKIMRWRGADEYRFIPQSFQVVKLEKNRKILNFKKDAFSPWTFNMYPSYEIRSYKERKASENKVNKIISREAKKVERSIPVEQKGRGSLYVAFANNTIFEGEKRLDDLNVFLTWPVGKFGFFGFQFDYDFYPEDKNKSGKYGFGGEFGWNFRMGRNIRPYIQLSALGNTNAHLIAKAGGGIDLTFMPFLINLGYDFNWDFNCNNYEMEKPLSKFFPPECRHEFRIGFGFAW